MYYSAIGLLAALILLIENQDVLLNRRGSFEKPAWKAYRRFLFAVLAYYVTDILWGIMESRRLAGLLFADTTVYFIAMAAGVLSWAQFTVAYLDEKKGLGRFLVYPGQIIAALITILSIINIFTPVLFTVDADGVYNALPTRYGILSVQVLLLLLTSAYAISSILRNASGKRSRYRALAIVGLIEAVFLFIQLWNPMYPLYTTAYLLGTSLIHTFVVIDEKEEFERGLEEAARTAKLKNTISSLLDNIPGMTFTKDAETGIYLACNQAFAAYAKKKKPDDVIGYTDAELFDAATAEHFAEDDRMALSMDEAYIFFENVPDGADGRRQFQTTELKYTDNDGRLCLLGLIQDVTDMVRIQRKSATTVEAYEKARGTGVMYSHIAQSMARSYSVLYYVNIDSEEFIEYRTEEPGGALTEKRRGWHFYEECEIIIDRTVYREDRAALRRAMDRKTMEAALDRNRIFITTFRIVTQNGPAYVTMKVSRMEDDDRYIIIGIADVDEQMQQRRAEERMKEEQIAYARLSVLAGDFLSIYIVDPETNRYREIRTAAGYESLVRMQNGEDFFRRSRDVAEKLVHPEDLNRFRSLLTKENIMAEIDGRGFFTLSYRIMVEGEPHYVQLKAAMLEEPEGQRLIVGINDIDAQVRQEEAYVQNLAQAQIEAHLDPLTGVKNRHAYLEAEERLNLRIAEGRVKEFAVVLLDVNDLKTVNDVKGHQAGDQFIRDACKIICDTFKHSPVFRVGGDEFTVIAQGNDYARIDELVETMEAHNAQAVRTGGIVIACGMAKRENENSVAPVFVRADQRMYENKNELKAKRREGTK